MSGTRVAVAFRWPRLPVIVSDPGLWTASVDRGKLLQVLAAIAPTNTKWEIRVLDATGREFWYDGHQRILAPGFAAKVRTKRQLIELYNGSGVQAPYLPRSLQNYRLERIVAEIAELLLTRRPTKSTVIPRPSPTGTQEGQGAG